MLNFFRSKDEAIKEFYKTNADLSSVLFFNLVQDLRHRQIRFDLGNRFQTLRQKVVNSKELSAALAVYSPRNAYYSVSKWIEPHKVVPKYHAEKISENLFLGCDLAFDIDFKPFSYQNVDRARQNCLSLLDFLSGKKIGIIYVAFSGSKGFHVLCNDPYTYPAPDPYVREAEAKKYRETIIEEIKTAGIIIDSAVSIDTRRIIRIPGTINYSTGYICRALPFAELQNSAKEILKNTIRANYSSLRTLWDDNKLRLFRSISGDCAKKGKPNLTYFSTYISTSVLGINDHIVPVFLYHNEKIGRVRQILKTLQLVYSLSDIYLFTADHEISGICLDSLPLKRALKVAKASKSLGYSKLFKYHNNWFRIDGKFSADGETRSQKPYFLELLPNQSLHQKSSGHMLMLEKVFGIKVRDIHKNNKHGKEEYKTIHAIMDD